MCKPFKNYELSGGTVKFVALAIFYKKKKKQIPFCGKKFSELCTMGQQKPPTDCKFLFKM